VANQPLWLLTPSVQALSPMQTPPLLLLLEEM
jgi:hypothetical protein